MITIKDPAIEPFRIQIDEDQYSVVRVQISQKGKSEGKELIFPVAYCNKFENAIRVIVRHKMGRADQEQTLAQYVAQYREVSETIINAVKLPE